MLYCFVINDSDITVNKLRLIDACCLIDCRADMQGVCSGQPAPPNTETSLKSCGGLVRSSALTWSCSIALADSGHFADMKGNKKQLSIALSLITQCRENSYCANIIWFQLMYLAPLEAASGKWETHKSL